MTRPALILIADDNEVNRDILDSRLRSQGYATLQAGDGEAALAMTRQHRPDLILLDVVMPKIDGIEVCRRLKADVTLPFTPIVLVTAKADSRDVVAGLDAGADEYLTKPIDQAALAARVRSVLRLKALHDQAQAQAAELATLNRTLEQRVADQVAEIERIGRLRHFLSPQMAELVMSSGGERLLESHRQDVTVVFCDLRGFTAFSEEAEPQEVMAVLRDYHTGLGALVRAFEATVEHFAGDGLMVLFNDPLPCSDPPLRAVTMAVAMRDCVRGLIAKWQKSGYDLGFGIGIAHGTATLGLVGFEGGFSYAAIGRVANLAARLCNEARNGQILVDSDIQAAVREQVEMALVGDLTLKGFHGPVRTFNVMGLLQQGMRTRTLAAN